METLWFVLLAFMLTVYVVLDGFDFGTGIVYLFVARADEERRALLAAIGPVWNGNEVWLIASGGLLFFAFPRAYAAGFSGFYLALIIVLWLFILRGLSLELRSHFDQPLWTGFWDAGFALASLLLAVVFGAALGNLIRGVPLNADGYFFTPFWTDFLPGPEPGILDWFTLLMALTTTAILTLHGANYVVMKTSGETARRASYLARQSGWTVVVLTLVALSVVPFVQPTIHNNYDAHPIGWTFPLLAVGGMGLTIWAGRHGQEVASFGGSSLLIIGLLAATAWGVYPNLLTATGGASVNSLTIDNAAASPHGLTVGLGWFCVGIVLVALYSVSVHRMFWGKVPQRDLASDRR
ncbi:Cytochrome bd oxidase, subunit II [Nitrospira tepida]|uniref:Cytochrome bd oxidase, subunit II n=1 Tax=Nitrospira tepida TaxID=2973512 RepID=A0AA86MY17_9BACT|nr:cytochrome d ubiquinol oxidase subunit II [Nitrospira tepida]CAI4031036.1 Cytochrome bd oxidase, subunit II [Nitrospira tepida]